MAQTHFRLVHTTAGNKSNQDRLTREFNQIMLKSDPGKVSDLITTILILIIFIAMSTIKILVSKNF